MTYKQHSSSTQYHFKQNSKRQTYSKRQTAETGVLRQTFENKHQNLPPHFNGSPMAYSWVFFEFEGRFRIFHHLNQRVTLLEHFSLAMQTSICIIRYIAKILPSQQIGNEHHDILKTMKVCGEFGNSKCRLKGVSLPS